MVPFQELVYLPTEARYEETDKVAAGTITASISGTQVRTDYLGKGNRLPDWFTRPEIATILAELSPPTHQTGFCIWFTGLSGAGKSTIADILAVLLMEQGRQVTLLDGDVVRTHISKGLGFSKEDRDTNIRRIGYVARLIARSGGVAITAAISPYRDVRDELRGQTPGFVEVFVRAPLDTLVERDTKG